MCGRFTLTIAESGEIKAYLHLKHITFDITPNYNITPTQTIYVVRNDIPDELSQARWGLIPHWAKDEKVAFKMINARGETINEKPSFRSAFRSQRCLILADSFFEWKRHDIEKIPFRIMLKNEGLFCMAGIWERWEKDGKERVTCSIITTGPNELLKNIHDRMPVILPQKIERKWLSDLTPDDALSMLKPFDSSLMKAYQISTLVNSPRNNSPEILVPVKK